MHIRRRQEVWEGLQREREAVGGTNSPTQKATAHKDRPQNQKKFAADLASVMPGVGKPETTKREINRKIKRAEELGTDLHKIAGTSLDKGVEMDALIKMREGDPRPLAISCRFLVGLSR